MEIATALLHSLDNWLGSAPYFPYLLLGTGLFFTLYLKFPQIRYFRHALHAVSGRYDRPDLDGDASHFQALTTALSGTVGTGNIGGVALAIYLGGPAALFWMWMTAFLGMTTKFVEVTLSHKYRQHDKAGFIVGGPMYYMDRRLNMKWLAMFFAAATVISSFGTGNLPQSNNMAVGMQSTFGVPTWVTGTVLSVMLALVIIGGIRRIVRVTEMIVPFMAALYLFGALCVILVHADRIIPAFTSIFFHAFNGTAASGGFLGATFAYAFNRGVNRGLFSNEAGQGSAPIAHSAARADEPISEGFVSILEPFIDTIIICTITGLVILTSGVWTEKFENQFQTFDMEIVEGVYTDANPEHQRALFRHLSLAGEDDAVQPYNGVLNVSGGQALNQDITIINNRSIAEDVIFYRMDAPLNGDLQVVAGKLADQTVSVRGRSLIHSVELTTRAFTRGWLGEYGQYVVAIGLVLFAFSTAIAWSYYGDRAITYLFGLRLVMPYRIVYVAGFFLAAVADTSFIWLISAITIALMTIPNLFGILMLHREMKQTIAEYWEQFTSEYGD